MLVNIKSLDYKSSLNSDPSPQEQSGYLHKELQRKPSNFVSANGKKKASGDSFRYMTSTSMRNDNSFSSASLHLGKSLFSMEDSRTERKDENLNSSKRYNDNSADYYKYWKKKANEYQQENFELHKLNSGLQQEIETLKFKVEKLEKKSLNASTQVLSADKTKQNYEKLDYYYRVKIEHLTKKVTEQ